MLPVIDMTPLFGCDESGRQTVARQIERACRDTGFFYVTGHRISPDLIARLDTLARAFFALPEAEKMQIAMAKGGRAWRGFFPVGGELTSGRPDVKEGIYFGSELPPTDARVKDSVPLHGGNLFPPQVPELRGAVLAYLDAATRASHALMEGIALSLGLEAQYFRIHYTADPTILFRIFHYPSAIYEDGTWGVGEHT
ncbi:MAG: isopenicillin N synthase family dioxygenase, partial [Caulobacteraceae bacterium]